VEILDSLTKADLAVEIPVEGTARKTYQPAKNIDLFTIASVIEAVENAGSSDFAVAKTASLERISASLRTFTSLVESSDANVKLKDI
jgi:hypothetical protein